MDYNAVGERIKKARAQHTPKVTQKALGQAIGGKTESLVAKYEHGDVNIPMETIHKIAAALDTTAAYLMGETDNPARGPWDNLADVVSTAQPIIDEAMEKGEKIIQRIGFMNAPQILITNKFTQYIMAIDNNSGIYKTIDMWLDTILAQKDTSNE